MKLIDAEKLCEYARNQVSGSVDANDIMRFPTVDVEPKWIPVSERLPNELERVLITVRYDNDRKDRVVQVGSVYTDRFGDLVWQYNEEYGFCKSRVLAWMPLPNSYGKTLPTASELMLDETCQEEEQDG